MNTYTVEAICPNCGHIDTYEFEVGTSFLNNPKTHCTKCEYGIPQSVEFLTLGHNQ